MKILQINVDRRRVAQELLFQTAAKEASDLVLVCEPNITRLRKARTWYVDTSESCCIIRRNPRIKVWDWGNGRSFVWVRTEEVTVYCVYISPNVVDAEYDLLLRDILDNIRDKGNRIIIGGDFNAKSPLWGSVSEDRRGVLLAEWAADGNLISANIGDTPTFQRGNSHSVIDVTFASDDVHRDINTWRVLEEESGSLHRYIAFDVRSRSKGSNYRGEAKRNFRPEKFQRIIERNIDRLRLPMDPGEFTESLYRWQEEASDRVRPDSRGNTVFWWTEEIQALRSSALASRRRLTRITARRPADEGYIDILRGEYKAARKDLKTAIVRSKARCWKQLCADLENDIWGEGFKIMTRTLKQTAPKIDLDRDRRIAVAEALFPDADSTSWEGLQLMDTHPDRVSEEELVTAADRLKSNRAPGPDQILPETVKIIAKKHPDITATLFDGLLQGGRFPSEWKVGRLVLAPKPGRDLREASGFRPICLLGTLGKLYEAIIVGRVDRELEIRGPLHDRQYGFRKGRSAVDAIEDVIGTIKRAGANKLRALILVDVKNAFNSANWRKIVDSLLQRGISGGIVRVICDYLENRKLQICPGHSRETNIGVPQGSILGPTLWNVLYDGILNMVILPGTKLVAYADDLAIIIVADTKRELEQKANEMLSRVDNWLTLHHLQLAPEKTELTIFSMIRVRDLRFRIRDFEVHPKSSVKYLGVIIDRHLNYAEHITAVCAKADRTAGAVIRLMPNISGPSSFKRRALAHVVHSTLLYAAPVWADGLNMGKYKASLITVQRKVALRVARAYRTVATDALLVIAGVIPIQLMVDERRRLRATERDNREGKRAEREITFRKWQELYDASPKGRWTARLIRDVKEWVGRKHGDTDYFLTQFLSGHGSFGGYLVRIGKRTDDACLHCGESDSAEHTVFSCPRFEGLRQEMEMRAGFSVTVENIVPTALRNTESWNGTMGVVSRMMKAKEEDMKRVRLNP